MKKTLKTTDAIQKWLDGINSGILRPHVDKLYAPENRFIEMLTLGHPVLSHYDKHISAMTREKLDSKSDIAAELGWRDWQIEQLNERIKELKSQKHISVTEGACPPQKQYRANIVAFFNNLRGKNGQ